MLNSPESLAPSGGPASRVRPFEGAVFHRREIGGKGEKPVKAVVVYCSQTGFTKRYAQWIAEAAGADCLALPEAKKRDLSGYEAVVFGGWACAGGIKGIGWFKRNVEKWGDKKLAAFCVGASPIDSPDIEPALRRNFTDVERQRVSVFYCPGGLDYERMPAPSKLAMKLFAKAVQSKKDKTQGEEVMARMICASYDISGKQYIAPILQYLKNA